VQREDHRLVGIDQSGKNRWPPTPVARDVIVRHTRDPRGQEMDNVVMFSTARDAGQRIFVDLDDDIWRLPPWNPAYIFFDAERQRIVERNLAAADGVLASTPTLAAQLATHTDTPVHVCPNGVDVSMYRLRTAEHSPLRVGWCGMTDWRIGDLLTIVDDLTKALNGRDVELWHVGWEEHRMPIRDVFGDLDVRIVERPWVPMSQLPRALAELDIAVVPLEDIALNESRSATTGLALAAAGIPTIATPMPAYAELARCGGCWVTTDWVDVLGSVLDMAPSQRLAQGAGMRAAVSTFYRPDVTAQGWRHALEQPRR